jgi:hypothetical protein
MSNENKEAVCSGFDSGIGSYDRYVGEQAGGWSRSKIYLGIHGDISAGHKEGHDNGRDKQDNYLCEQNPTFGSIFRIESERGQWPEVSVSIHAKQCKHDCIDVLRDQPTPPRFG